MGGTARSGVKHTVCNLEVREGGGAEGEADGGELGVDACAFRLVEGRAGEAAPAVCARGSAGWCWRVIAKPRRVRAEVDSEDGELAVDVRAEVALLLADAKVAVQIGRAHV